DADEHMGNAEILSFDVEANQQYKILLNDAVKQFHLVGRRKVEIISGEKSEKLDFSIVYKEELKGNVHLLMAHIAFAIVVTIFVLLFGMFLMKKKAEMAALGKLGSWLLVTLGVQITLGVVAYVTVSDRQNNHYDQTKTILTSAHLANGALLLALCAAALYFCRKGFVKSDEKA
ncbi:MAG: hypothetical protein HRT88_10750, partial [Lentisphaeraceae bacterium]|nr:hypothetical protein [Lentisphaeraceae bacterium]